MVINDNMVAEKITETIYIEYLADSQNIVNLLSVAVKGAIVQNK